MRPFTRITDAQFSMILRDSKPRCICEQELSMATILLSIKLEYVERIFNGSKKFEFRKHLPQKKVDRIIVYSTDPMQRVVGEVDVLGRLTMKLSPLWEATKTAAGISCAKYRAYFKGCATAYAF